MLHCVTVTDRRYNAAGTVHSLFFFFSSLASFFSLAVLVGAFLFSLRVSLAFMVAAGWC